MKLTAPCLARLGPLNLQVGKGILGEESNGDLLSSAWGVLGLSRAPCLTKTVTDLDLPRDVAEAPPTKNTLQEIFPKGHRSVWANVFLLLANLAGVELPGLL